MLLRAVPPAAAARALALPCKPPWRSLVAVTAAEGGGAEGAAAGAAIRRVGVVGAGPSAFYATKFLLKELGAAATVELIDRLPTPFGLVRTGVAPDHPEVKAVQRDFEKVAEDPRFRFYGNVTVGSDVDVATLRSLYDVLILAHGASEDRRLGIPGEDLQGVLSARAFVNWYNGHPDYAADGALTALLRRALEGEGADVVVLGQGNVALDCARILAKQSGDLAATDICQHALGVLARSRVRTISVVGRRGHGQAAFTIKELRELTRIRGAACVADPWELRAGLTDFTVKELEASRPRKRLADLVQSLPAAAAAAPAPADGPGNGHEGQLQQPERRTVALRFLLMPRAALPDPADPSRVGALRLERARLEQKAGSGRVVAAPTGEMLELPCRLLLRSIGYKSLPIPGLPFDPRCAVVPNRAGRVLDSAAPDAPPVPGLYCTGWVKRGPTGIIGTNIADARETVAAILEDAAGGRLPAPTLPESVSLVDLVKRKDPREVVTWDGYRRIDEYERVRGEAAGKPREKCVDVGEMVRLAAAGAGAPEGASS